MKIQNTTTARGRRSMDNWLISILAVSLLFTPAVVPTLAAQTWSAQHARQWYAGQAWLVGSNFVPSTAINELEMWQADSFDLKTIAVPSGLTLAEATRAFMECAIDEREHVNQTAEQTISQVSSFRKRTTLHGSKGCR